MQLEDLISVVPAFVEIKHVQRIKIFAWFLYRQKGLAYFNHGEILKCYDSLKIAPPANIYQLLSELTKKRPKEVLKNSSGYYLEAKVLAQLDGQYGQRPATVQVHQILAGLVGKISSQAEQAYLSEALICVKNGAPRAAIIMTWNLAYDHLLNYIIAKHLADFNSAWVSRFPGQHSRSPKSIAVKEDFGEELKENQVIEICKTAGIITRNQFKVMDEKLTRRNLAAHPNDITFVLFQVEDFISDLITNAVLPIV